MDPQRDIMEKFLHTLTSSKTCPILKDDKYNGIINALQNPEKCKDPQLKLKITSYSPAETKVQQK